MPSGIYIRHAAIRVGSPLTFSPYENVACLSWFKKAGMPVCIALHVAAFSNAWAVLGGENRFEKSYEHAVVHCITLIRAQC